MENRDVRVKRLKMRSMRRGIKEMDLILGGFAKSGLDGLTEADLALYDVMLEENDHDLYAWACGAADTPEKYAGLMTQIMSETDVIAK